MKTWYRLQTWAVLLALCVGLFATFAFPALAEGESTAWDGTVGTAFDGGSGTEEDPYLIGSGKTLAYLAYLVNEVSSEEGGGQQRNVYFRLTADIDLGGKPWTAIGKDYGGSFGNVPFNGNFDGAGHVVRNLNAVTAEGAKIAGLFGLSYTAHIQNLGIESGTVTVTAMHGAGILAVAQGVTDGNTLIENCYNNATVRKEGNLGGMTEMGGIVGYSVHTKVVIRDCVNYGLIDGGVAGANRNTSMGGIVGFAQRGTIESCYNLGRVNAGFARGGGLFGMSNQPQDLVVKKSATAGLVYNRATDNALPTGTFVGNLTGAPKEISECTVYTKAFAEYPNGTFVADEKEYRVAQTLAGEGTNHITGVTVNTTDEMPSVTARGEKYVNATEWGKYLAGSIGNGTPTAIDGVADEAYLGSFARYALGSEGGMRADLHLVADARNLYLFATVTGSSAASDTVSLTVAAGTETVTFRIARDGTLTADSAGKQEASEAVVLATDGGWTAEALLPVSLMGIDSVNLIITLTNAAGEHPETLEAVPVRGIRGNEGVAVTGIRLNQTELALKTGESATLTAKVTPLDAFDPTVEWSSSDTTVLSVSDRGVVKASKPGRATVTAKTRDGGHEATCTVTVTPNEVTGVTLSLTELTLEVGKKKLLICTVTPENADDKNVTWTSKNEAVATVSANGLVTAQGGGETDITVTTEDGSFVAVCHVTVSVTLSGLTLSESEISMTVGEKKTVSAEKTPLDATDTLTWESSDSTVVSVNEQGELTALAAGSATVTVKNADGSIHAALIVTVTESAESTPTDTEKPKGCASALGAGLPMLLAVAAIGTVAKKRKHGN